MSQNFVEGSVVSQQTALSFQRHPPSSVGSCQLPWCVSEQRGRERGFAMAQHTQLRFNLAVPPNPANLASSFTSSPSPVVIQRVSLPQKPFTALSTERLALAVRLARRDLQQGTVPSQLRHTPATAASLAGGVPAHRTQPLSPASHENAPVIAQPTVSQSPYPPPLHGTPPPPPPPPPRPHGTPPHPPPPTGIKSGADVCDATAAEIVQLRRELGLQLQRLRELAKRKELTEVCGPTISSGCGRTEVGEGSRVQWDTEKSEEERRWKREREQDARNTRMLYSLRQEVAGLQRELDAPRQKATLTRVRHTRKLEAIHRLAAAHRAAVRILRHYTASTLHTGTSHPLPAELALLLQKLSLLCAKLEVGGAKEEVGGAREAEAMELLLQQIKESSQNIAGGVSAERGTPVSQEPLQGQPRISAKPAHSGWSERTRSAASRPAGTELDCRGRRESAVPLVHHAALSGERRGYRRTRKVPPKGKKTSVLLHPQLRPRGQRKRRLRTPHFTQATHSSQLKQHKAIGKPPAPSLHPSVPHSWHPPHTHQHTSTSSPQHHPSPYQRGRVQFPSPEQWTGKEAHTTAAEQIRERCQPGTEGNSPPLETEYQPGTGRESPPVETETEDGFGPWSALEPMLVVGGRRQREDQGQREMEGAQGGRRESEQSHGRSINMKPDAVPRKTAAIQRLEHPAAVEGGARGVLEQPDLVAMLSRIEELQLEEESIRQKWTTISYGDPFSRPQPAPSLKNYEPPTPVLDAQPSPLPLSIPPSLLSSVQQYRDSHERYLRLTGVRTTGGFNPWELVERLADDLLDELVQEVSLELGQLCDSCVEQLYSHEFARPSDTPR